MVEGGGTAGEDISKVGGARKQGASNFFEAAKKLREKGYGVTLFKDGLNAVSTTHLLSKGWCNVVARKGKPVVFMCGTKATVFAWVLGVFFGYLIFIIRSLTIQNVNEQTYSDAYCALYGFKPELELSE